MKRMPLIKSTEVSEVALEICQVWKQKPLSISLFPLGDRCLLKNERGFPADILSVREKKITRELMWILSRMILPKIPLLAQGGFFDISGRFLQHLLTV